MLLKIILVFAIGASMIMSAPIKDSNPADQTQINTETKSLDSASSSNYLDDLEAQNRKERWLVKHLPE